MRSRASALAFAVVIAPLALGTGFVDRPFPSSGVQLNLVSLVALQNGMYFVGGRAVVAPFRAYSASVSAGGATGILSTSGADDTNVGAHGFGPGSPYVYMTEHHVTSGHAYIGRFNRSTGLINGSYQFSDLAGPIYPVKNGVSVDSSGNVSALFELRPSDLSPRTAIVIEFPNGSISGSERHDYSLASGQQILDCVPRPEGGLVYLSGTPAAASTNIVATDGTRTGPFFVGAASQVAYSTANGGEVFTAGSVGSSAFFTRGPKDGGITSSSIEALPIANSGLTFECGIARGDGTCWWGGSYTTLLNDTNGFISGTTPSPDLDLFGTATAGSSPQNETVHDLSVSPDGRGVWAGDGLLGMFNASNGQTLASYPPVQDLTIEYRAVVNAPWDPTGFPFSNFGVIGFNRNTNSSRFVVVNRGGDLRNVDAVSNSLTGGLSTTVMVTLFKANAINTDYQVSSSSATVSVPTKVTLPAGEPAQTFQITTSAVTAQEDVLITVGSNPSVQTHVIVLPPTPKLFTPASQIVVGGSSVLSRLTLSGKAPIGGLTVALSSDGPELTVSPNVVVPAGLYSRSFLIRTKPVGSTVVRSVTASYANVSRATAITLTP